MEEVSRVHIASLIGETLVMLQKFEQLTVAFLLCTVSESDVDRRLEKLLLRNKEVLGKLLKELSARTSLPDHFSEDLDSLLEMRNIFVHKLFLEPSFALNSPDGRLEIDGFMEGMRYKLKLALYVLLGAVCKMKNFQMSSEAVARFKFIIDRIGATSGRDFGGLAEDAYIEKVLNTAIGIFESNSKISSSGDDLA